MTNLIFFLKAMTEPSNGFMASERAWFGVSRCS